MGLMAGYGLQLWPILQDFSQLEALYGRKAATFLANAGVLQAFNVNDLATARWLSELIGASTIAYSTGSSTAQGWRPPSQTTAEHLTARRLDETLRGCSSASTRGSPTTTRSTRIVLRPPERPTIPHALVCRSCTTAIASAGRGSRLPRIAIFSGLRSLARSILTAALGRFLQWCPLGFGLLALICIEC